MRKNIFLLLLFLFFTFLMPLKANGQMMGSTPPSQDVVNQTQKDQEAGNKLVSELKNKQITCQKLSSDDFEKLGEYFMGQMVGDTARHAAMNQMMQNMMGNQGEEQMHVQLGKQQSGCDGNINMMGGGSMIYGMPGMMFGLGWGILGIVWSLFWFVLLIVGIVFLVRWLRGESRLTRNNNKPLDILKERYAKGEITKKEFEQMKKDIS